MCLLRLSLRQAGDVMRYERIEEKKIDVLVVNELLTGLTDGVVCNNNDE